MNSAVKVTWILADGMRIEASLAPGSNLMEAALSNNVVGITGDCGGSLACATCHVLVEETPAPLPPPSDIEQEMLEMAPVPASGASRLSCQLIATAELDGIVLRVPE